MKLDPAFWKDKTIVVTGGAGFLGSFICDRLQALPSPPRGWWCREKRIVISRIPMPAID